MKIRLPQGWKLFVVGFLALILAHWMALVFRIQPAVSLWFPPSGVSVVLTLWLGSVGIALTGLTSVLMAPVWGSDGWFRWVGLTDMIEPLVAWFLYRYCWRGSLTLNSLKNAVAWVISAPLLASSLSASFGTLTLTALGRSPIENLVDSMQHWWLGNAIGIMTIAPPVLLLLTPVLDRQNWLPVQASSAEIMSPDRPLRWRQRCRIWVELGAIALLTVGTALFTVVQAKAGGLAFQQFSFLNFVAIIWAATRFGAIGGVLTASSCVLFTLMAYLIVYPNALSLPQFPVDPEILHVHKLNLLVQSIVSLLVGIATTEQARVQASLAIERVRSAEYELRAQLSDQLAFVNQSLAIANAQLQQSNCEKDELLKLQQAARREAETANRTKDHFLAIVSHELRSPLNPILGWANLLRSRPYDEKITRNALEVIERNAKLQAQLIDDLLDVSRILRGKLRLDLTQVELTEVVNAAIETVQLSANAKKIQIHKIFSPCWMKGDPGRLQQVVWNLLSNAIKFTPNEGEISVRLDRVGEFARIQVSDTGKGIAPALLPRVFESFWQEESSTNRNAGGLGLGLAIVKHLVELHGGNIRAESEGEGKGATFTVMLPLG